MTEQDKAKKGDQVERKIKSAAEDVREAARNDPDRSGDLHLQASAIDRVAESAKVTLEDERPMGRSGQGIERPAAASKGEPPAGAERRTPGRKGDHKGDKS